MDRILSLALFTATLLPATSLTLPGGLETTEGNGSTFLGAFFGSSRVQVQVAASELAAQGLQPGFALTALRLRLAGGAVTNATDLTIPDLEILLGEAVNTVAGMSTVYDDNVANGLVVHDGAYTFLAGSMPGGATPNAFGPAIAFSSAYIYQGGDLIIEIRRLPLASGSLGIDASSSHAGSGTLYGGLTGSFSATSGTFTNHMPVMQMEYETPEPASAGLAALGLAALVYGFRNSAGANARREKRAVRTAPLK